jgi:cytochrome c553
VNGGIRMTKSETMTKPQVRRERCSPVIIRALDILSCFVIRILSVLLCFLGFAACRQDMYNQPKAKTYSATEFFADGTSARSIPLHTVEYHDAHESEAFYTGLTNGVLLAKLPMPVTPELLQRGRERYDIYCAVCHGATGAGDGEIVRRGFPAPSTYHSERLRQAPIGHFYDVITNGYGVMYSYASRVEPNDRWAVAAYLRALQLSQHAIVGDLPPDEQKQLEQRR